MGLDRNLVVVLTSGHRADGYGRARAWPIGTPHLDTLAEGGIDLPSVSVSPAAGPSLVSLLTGLHPRQHGVLDDGVVIPKIGGWAKQFAEAGFHVAGVGRVAPIADQLYQACIVGDLGQTLGPCPYLQFAGERGVMQQVTAQRQQRLRTGPFELNGSAIDSPGDDIDGFIGEQAAGLIDRLPRDRPWVLIVSLTGPGNDLPAPRRLLEKIDPAALTENFIPADLKRVDRYAQLPYPRLLLQKLTAKQLGVIRRHYLARVIQIDEVVGQIRRALEFSGQASKTWIAMTSDHGTMLGERGLVGHRASLSGAAYVPFWVLPPESVEVRARAETASTSQLLSTMDFAATLCAIGGVDAPRGCIGRSALPALHGAEVGGDAVVSEFGTRLMLETTRHRIVFDVERDEPVALFDLVSDPDERFDLIDTVQAWNLIDVLRLHLACALMPLRPVRG